MDTTEKKVEEARNKLSDIMTALNRENLILEEKQKLKQDIQGEIKLLEEAEEIAKEKTKKSKEDKNISEGELLVVKNEISKEQDLLSSVKVKIESAEKDLSNFKEKSIIEIAEINSEKATAIDKMEVIKKENTKEEASLKESKNKLLMEIEVKEKSIKSLQSDIEKLDSAIESKKVLNTSLEKEGESLERANQKVKSDILDQEVVVKKKSSEIESLKGDIEILKSKKEVLGEDIKELEEGKSAFVQAKILLQKDKEELTNRELFIMEKYSQAGLPYKEEQLSTTKSLIIEKADLQQWSDDLDKREKVIKDKYKEAGLDYL